MAPSHLNDKTVFFTCVFFVAPCGDGTERNRLGLCSECERGTYRSSTVQHVCEPCSFGQTTNNAGAVLPSDCISKN